jgi:hypothetical protein
VYDSGTTGWACVTPKAASAGAEYTGWGIGMRVVIDNELTTITDVFPFLPNTTVAAVFKDDVSVATIVPGTPPPSVRRDATVLINGYAHRILSVITGPENTLSFRVLDNVVPGGITAGLSLRFPISFRCYLTKNHAAGVAIGAKAFQSVMTLGTGTTTGTGMIYNNAVGPINGMSVNNRPITDEDYVHVSIAIDNPANVAEVHFLLDIDAQGHNDFQHNYFYYVVRQNDFQSVAQGTQTSIGGLLDALTAQIASTYPVEKDKIQYAQSPYPAYQQPEFGIPVSDQLGAGNEQWFEAIFKVNDLTRVGSDISTNLSNIRGAAVLVELLGNATVSIGGWWIGGTYGPDCNYNSYGNQGMPISYRYRYRSSLTGAFSEVSPGMRNGILAMRSGVLVSVVASPDTQVDLIDIERNGGTFDTWHRCLVVPNTTAQVLDDVRETVAMGGDPLELLHYQPWPVTDQPRSGTCQIVGNRLHRLSGDTFNLAWIRGVEVIVNQETYTLFASPYTANDIELAQNVGNFPNVPFKIPEATIAAYPLAFACAGMDGRIFATGDPFNPGNLYFSWPYEPDSASDQGYIEVTSPGEPLGPPVYYEGAIYVFSNLCGYRVESTPGQANPYTAYKLGTVPGQTMPWAISAEGPAIFYRGADGVYMFVSGQSVNITQDDLFPLLPFESRPGLPVSVAGQTIFPPDDTVPQCQVMAYADGMLFYDFMDTNSSYYTTLVYTPDTKGWIPYRYFNGSTVHYQEQGVENPLTLMGDANGYLYYLDAVNQDDGADINCVVVTPADDQGNSRATKEYGDLMMDLGVQDGSAASGSPLSVTVYYENFLLNDAVQNPALTQKRWQYDLKTDYDGWHRNIGLLNTWKASSGLILYEWQPSFILQPETATTRPTDWQDAGTLHYKFVHGARIFADTKGQDVQMQIEYEGGIKGPIVTVNSHGEETVVPVSFPPFKAHTMRLVPVTGAGDWILNQVEWDYDLEPEPTGYWVTQPTSWDMPGFLHIRDFQLAYASTAGGGVLTLTVDGQPYTLIANLASTSGNPVKKYFVAPPVKGKLWSLYGTGTALQIYRRDCEFRVKPWGGKQYEVVRAYGDENRTSTGARM